MKHERARWVRNTGVSWSLVAGLLLAVAVVVGIVQNSQGADVHYLGWTGHASLAVLLLATIVATVALSAIAGVGWRRSRRHQLTGRQVGESGRDAAPHPPPVVPLPTDTRQGG